MRKFSFLLLAWTKRVDLVLFTSSADRYCVRGLYREVNIVNTICFVVVSRRISELGKCFCTENRVWDVNLKRVRLLILGSTTPNIISNAPKLRCQPVYPTVSVTDGQMGGNSVKWRGTRWPPRLPGDRRRLCDIAACHVEWIESMQCQHEVRPGISGDSSPGYAVIAA